LSIKLNYLVQVKLLMQTLIYFLARLNMKRDLKDIL